MAKIDNFSGLTRPQEDLLKKSYCFGSLALLNVSLSKDNFTFHTRLSEKVGENPLASAWLQYKNDLLLLKGKRRNDRLSYYKLEVVPSKFIKNVKVVCECKLEDGKEADPTVNLEYNSDKFRGKVSYLFASNTLRVQETFGKPELGFGLDAKLNLDSFSVTNHSQALWYFKDSSRLVLKHVGKDLKKIGGIDISYLHEISKDANLGSKVSADWASRNTSIEVGGDYRYDSETWLKGKINSQGRVALALTRQLSKNFRASVATELTSRSLLSDYSDPFKLGFRLDFTD